MNINTAWLNSLLDRPITADEAEHALTFAGFPIESRQTVSSAGEQSVTLDVEITSNRGDCLCHLGIAREIAAATGRLLVFNPPALVENGPPVKQHLALANSIPDACPMFTARVILGVKVGPSPAWLSSLLESVGQRSINNLVDITNWMNLALGQPAHVFDLRKLAGARLDVRSANSGESLVTLDGKKRTLAPGDMVIADANGPTSIGGIMGGQASEVDSATADVVLEVATWAPARVRATARRLMLRTDASHRYERIVDPRVLASHCDVGAAMIAQVAGGKVCIGRLDEGRDMPKRATVTLRPARCRAVVGAEISREEMVRVLGALELAPREAGAGGDALISCEIPPHRAADLTREIDLIEEVARVIGHDRVKADQYVRAMPRAPQSSERAAAEIHRILTGLGFFETITFSFVPPATTELYMPPGLASVAVDEARRRDDPTLRPSVIPSLLACRQLNLNTQGDSLLADNPARFYELASVYAQGKDNKTVENRNLALVSDVPGARAGKPAKHDQLQRGIRQMRGAVEALVAALHGSTRGLGLEAAEPHAKAFEAAGFARLTLRRDGKSPGAPLGYFGVVSKAAMNAAGLEVPCVACELSINALISGYPPRATVAALPRFPGVERDASLIVDEQLSWAALEARLREVTLENLEDLSLAAVFRGPQVGEMKKSMTVRARFRRADRTLTHEEVDAEVARLIDHAKFTLGATLRQ